MEEYNINIPNEKATSYKLVSFIIALINLAVFVYYNIRSGELVFSSIGIVVSIFCLIRLRTAAKINWPAFVTAETGFAVLAVLWIVSGNYLPGFLTIMFSALGFYTNRKAVIRVNRNGIYYPSMPVKLFTWNMVEFAMLKDGILTFELKDNRVFQFTLSEAESAATDEETFNRFCRQRLDGSGE